MTRLSGLLGRLLFFFIHSAHLLGTEAEIELKGIKGVEIVEDVGDVMGLFESQLHPIVIRLITIAIMDVVGLLLRLEDVEERLKGNPLIGKNLNFTSLFVLHGLFDMLFGQILALLPVDGSTLNFIGPAGVSVRDAGELESLVLEVLVR